MYYYYYFFFCRATFFVCPLRKSAGPRGAHPESRAEKEYTEIVINNKKLCSILYTYTLILLFIIILLLYVCVIIKLL